MYIVYANHANALILVYDGNAWMFARRHLEDAIKAVHGHMAWDIKGYDLSGWEQEIEASTVEELRMYLLLGI